MTIYFNTSGIRTYNLTSIFDIDTDNDFDKKMLPRQYAWASPTPLLTARYYKLLHAFMEKNNILIGSSLNWFRASSNGR